MQAKAKVVVGRDGNVTVSSPDVVDPRVLMKLGMTEMSRRKFAQVAPKAFGFTPDVADKDDLMRLGEVLRKETYQHGGDEVAAPRLLEWAKAQDSDFMDLFRVEQNAIVYFAAARWADQAFPVVTMGEKFCAALMATKIPEEMLEEIEAPWHAFMIEVPGNMLSVFDPDSMRRTSIMRIFVHKTIDVDEPWRWVAMGKDGQHVWRIGSALNLVTPVQFRNREKVSYEVNSDDFENDLHRDERLYVLVGRLVLNACLVLADPDQVKRLGSSHKRHEAREGRRPGPPEQRVFQIGRPINLDCRDAIREYVEGERSMRELKIQSLVRGYWRQQPHGPKLSLRRKQWILPFWRGPADAPILVRPHVIPEES